MALLGRAVLILALITALYGIGASIYGARVRNSDWVDSGRRAMYSIFFLTLIAFVILEIAFIRNDFSYNVVQEHSSTTTPTFFKLVAAWSSQQGSLLLWVFLLSGWSTLALFLTRKRMRAIAPYAASVLLGFAAFFTMLMVFYANPFQTGPAQAQGQGLDPLLLHGSMMIHPPMLYSGYTLMAIPFAFAVGALITRSVGSEWLRLSRRFALAAWLFLGIGILLGARWSYTELGWGGYWAWDAVENAALLPWLATTAFIHSIMIQEKRGMLKVWNVSLVMLAGVLSIFGTFLVRSGVLDSIHAFGASTLGVPFVILLGVMLAGAIYLINSRRDILRSEHQLDSLLSREAIFLFQNLVLVAMVFVIFWLTVFPLVSAAVATKESVGPPTFSEFVVPLALILVLLTGIGPLIAWRRVTVANLRRSFVFPVAIALATLVWLLVGTVASHKPLALLMFMLGAFVLAGVVQELYRGTAARHAVSKEIWPVAFLSLVRRNRRRYGGYTVHAGFAIMLIGVAGSSSFQHEKQVSMKPGQSTTVNGYRFEYLRPTAHASAAKISLGAEVAIYHGSKLVTRMHTTRGLYPTGFNGQSGPISEAFNGNAQGKADSNVAVDAGLKQDLWVVVNAQPTSYMNAAIAQGDRVFEKYMQQLTPAEAAKPAENQFVSQQQGEAIVGITHSYITHPGAVTFLMIVDPLVSWLWIGALIIAFGGLIALWPAPALARRRSLATYSARLARELG